MVFLENRPKESAKKSRTFDAGEGKENNLGLILQRFAYETEHGRPPEPSTSIRTPPDRVDNQTVVPI